MNNNVIHLSTTCVICHGTIPEGRGSEVEQDPVCSKECLKESLVLLWEKEYEAQQADDSEPADARVYQFPTNR